MEKHKHPLHDIYERQLRPHTITVKDTAARLNLSEPTIYKYVVEGILESQSLPNKSQLRITEESIINFEQRYQKEGVTVDKGISLTAFARIMNITKARLLSIIKANNIELPKGKYGCREQYVITKEIQELIYSILDQSNHFPKTQFYNSRLNIGLYQSFTSKVNHNLYRIEREGDIWGIRGPMGLISFEVAEEQYKLIPNYSLRQRTRTNNSTIMIRLPLNNESFYSVIDTIYATFGMDNLQFKFEKEEFLLIYVKAASYKLQTAPENLKMLEHFLIGGELEIEESFIKLISYDNTFSITIPYHLTDKLEEIANRENLTKKQLVNKVIEDFLNN